MVKFGRRVRVKSQIERARRKRRALLIIFGIVGLFLISGFLWFLYSTQFRITDVSIDNDTALNDEILEEVIKQQLSEKYFYIFPKDNILIYPRSSLRNNIRSMSWEVLSVGIKRSGSNSIMVEIQNRVPYAVWCKNPASSDCFFVDKDGLIFLKASDFSKKLFPLLSGGVTGPPLGRELVEKRIFRNILSFVAFLEDNKLDVSYTKLAKPDASIKLASGGTIIFDPAEVEETAQNIKALLESEEVKGEGFDFDSIEYVDIRYGSKVFWKPN